jgi:hypothetical protein
MTAETVHELSASELVFSLLRTLMTGYRLWGSASGLELAQLPAALHTTEGRIATALRFLSGEGLVCVDEIAGTVRLSDSGARHFLGPPNLSGAGRRRGCVSPSNVALGAYAARCRRMH